MSRPRNTSGSNAREVIFHAIRLMPKTVTDDFRGNPVNAVWIEDIYDRFPERSQKTIRGVLRDLYRRQLIVHGVVPHRMVTLPRRVWYGIDDCSWSDDDQRLTVLRDVFLAYYEPKNIPAKSTQPRPLVMSALDNSGVAKSKVRTEWAFMNEDGSSENADIDWFEDLYRKTNVVRTYNYSDKISYLKDVGRPYFGRVRVDPPPKRKRGS